jgi:hypothetical protein
MIGHDNELMQIIFLLLAIVREHVKHSLGDEFLSEEHRALPRHGCDKECPVEGQKLRSRIACVSDSHHNAATVVPNRYTGPKGRRSFRMIDAAINGRSSTAVTRSIGCSSREFTEDRLHDHERQPSTTRDSARSNVRHFGQSRHVRGEAPGGRPARQLSHFGHTAYVCV